MSDYLIEKILPAKKVHLLAGISSAGKSRFILPALVMYASGYPIMGCKSNPVPWCIVCKDRPLSDVQDTITRIGFKYSDINIIPAFGKYNKTLDMITREIDKSGSQFVLWEGFDMMVKNPNSAGEVGEFLSVVTSHCEEGKTVLGTVGVAKLKPHEMYQNPRQLVAGTSIWERATSTNLIIQAIDPGNISDGRRLLYVSMKNDPSFAVGGKFDDNGILVFDTWAERDKGEKLAMAKAMERAELWNNLYH